MYRQSVGRRRQNGDDPQRSCRAPYLASPLRRSKMTAFSMRAASMRCISMSLLLIVVVGAIASAASEHRHRHRVELNDDDDDNESAFDTKARRKEKMHLVVNWRDRNRENAAKHRMMWSGHMNLKLNSPESDQRLNMVIQPRHVDLAGIGGPPAGGEGK